MIRSTEALTKYQKITGAQAVYDVIPKKIKNCIYPIVDCTPQTPPVILVKNAGTGAATLLTTSADKNKDTYLAWVQISVADASGSIQDNYVSFVDSGGTTGYIAAETASGTLNTGDSNSPSIAFPLPILLQKNSNVSSQVGASNGRVSIGYFIVDRTPYIE